MVLAKTNFTNCWKSLSIFNPTFVFAHNVLDTSMFQSFPSFHCHHPSPLLQISRLSTSPRLSTPSSLIHRRASSRSFLLSCHAKRRPSSSSGGGKRGSGSGEFCLSKMDEVLAARPELQGVCATLLEVTSRSHHNTERLYCI
jgi:hypothetical protein